jgi:hypothetical protein
MRFSIVALLAAAVSVLAAPVDIKARDAAPEAEAKPQYGMFILHIYH